MVSPVSSDCKERIAASGLKKHSLQFGDSIGSKPSVVRCLFTNGRPRTVFSRVLQFSYNSFFSWFYFAGHPPLLRLPEEEQDIIYNPSRFANHAHANFSSSLLGSISNLHRAYVDILGPNHSGRWLSLSFRKKWTRTYLLLQLETSGVGSSCCWCEKNKFQMWQKRSDPTSSTFTTMVCFVSTTTIHICI